MIEEIEFSIQRFHDEMTSVDDLVHVLLKGHLLIEEVLTRILELYLFHPEHLIEARLSFKHKAVLCRSLCLRKDNAGEWELISCLNSLRNELAHKLHSPEREKRLQRVKEIFFREMHIMKICKKSKNNLMQILSLLLVLNVRVF